MIKSIELSGAEGTYASKLPVWNRPLVFVPGLTIVAGPNGTGKSTVLKILGALTNLDGLSSGMAGKIPDLSTTREVEHQIAEWVPKRISSELARERLKLSALPQVSLDWDRTPVSVFSADTVSTGISYFGQTGDDLMDEVSLLQEKRDLSSGQRILSALNRSLAKHVQGSSIPMFDPKKLKSFNSHWSTRAEAWNRWVGEIPKTGTRTILMDEPDQSLSPIAQGRLWKQIARIAEEQATQIIAVSHSPFALMYGTVLETQPGYAANVREAIRLAAAELSTIVRGPSLPEAQPANRPTASAPKARAARKPSGGKPPAPKPTSRKPR